MLWIQETFEDGTQETIFGESDVYESYTDSKGELFRSCLREWGRCRGKIYIDTPEQAKPIGWVFESRLKYEDAPGETYLRRVWVTVHTGPPTKTIEYHYA